MIDETPTCDCGARMTEGQTHCSKCLARDRWLKKQIAAQRRANKRRRGTRRPPRDPRGIARMGAIQS